MGPNRTGTEARNLVEPETVRTDPFVVRVVVGGALTKSEQDEAIGRLAWKLRVPDGTLIVAGASSW